MSLYASQTPKNAAERAAALERRVEELEKRIAFSNFGSGAASGGGAGGGSGSGTCGLTFNPTTLNIPIPTGGSSALGAQGYTDVTSSIAQTVTFSASLYGTSPSCLGTPTVSPSTITFTAGQTIRIYVSIPYTNCGTAGQSFQLSLAYSTDSDCGGILGGSPGQSGGGTTGQKFGGPPFAATAVCNCVGFWSYMHTNCSGGGDLPTGSASFHLGANNQWSPGIIDPGWTGAQQEYITYQITQTDATHWQIGLGGYGCVGVYFQGNGWGFWMDLACTVVYSNTCDSAHVWNGVINSSTGVATSS
jgi:hypothetical protein